MDNFYPYVISDLEQESIQQDLDSKVKFRMIDRINMKKKVLVAMSGGVDSSVAAYLLKKEGYEVIGATMKLFCYGESASSPKSCCSLEAINDAKAVCKKLGMPHYVISYEKEFGRNVIENFISEYKEGRTPNPCIRCNQLIKFDYLLKKAEQLGCEYLATGHYSRKVKSKKRKVKSYKLLRGMDSGKDQTYFLYRLNQSQLRRLIFPLGGFKKSEVRELAKEAGLKTAEKRESQGICFVDGEVSDYLKGKIKTEKGDILDVKGEKIGEHEGAIFYTVGQRKGLGGGFTEPLYVLNIDIRKNTITIGEDKDLYKCEVEFEDTIWINEEPKNVRNLKAIIRYGSMEPEKITKLERKSGKYKAIFKNKVRAITPGQAIVFYRRDECLGGGIITNLSSNPKCNSF